MLVIGTGTAADRPRPFVAMRVRRQTAVGEIDAPAIEELTAGRDGDEHRRASVLSNADGGGSLHSCLRISGHSFTDTG